MGQRLTFFSGTLISIMCNGIFRIDSRSMVALMMLMMPTKINASRRKAVSSGSGGHAAIGNN
jgi:hypothetical protein